MKNEYIKISKALLSKGFLPALLFGLMIEGFALPSHSGPMSLLNTPTDCGAADVPFTQDFEAVATPELPACATTEIISGNEWKTTSNTYTSGFESIVLNYSYHSTEPADSWYFTQGINLEAGVTYEISYTYGNLAAYAEKLKVAFGPSAQSSAMSTTLIDHTSITSMETDEITFTVDSDAVYYFGFQAHSDANQNQIYVDDIHIATETEGEGYCIPVYEVTCASGIRIDNVTLEGETVTLNNSTGCSPNNYGDFTDLTPPDLIPGETYTLTVGSNYAISQFEEVRIWIDYNQNSSFESEEQIGFTDGNGLPEGSQSFDFTVPIDSEVGNYRMRVKLVYFYTDFDACSQESSGEAEDYTIEIISEDPCVEPSDLVLSSISDESINLSWTENGTATEWEVVYGTPGFDPESGTGTTINVTGAPNTAITDLTPETDYEAYVRSLCPEGGASAFAGPAAFTTTVEDCPGVSGITFTNTGDNSTEVSWTEEGAATQWAVVYGETGFDPEIGEGSTINVSGTPETIIAGLTTTTEYEVYVYSICSDGEASDYTGPAVFTTTMEDCPPVSDIGVGTITASSAVVNWTENGTATQWEIIYGTPGFDPSTEGLSVMDTDGETGFTLNDLEASTDYEVYVRPVCADEELGALAGPVSFTTEELGIEGQVFNNFNYYPIPVKGLLNLKANKPIESIHVYTFLGEEVMLLKNQQTQTQLHLGDLASGIYLMTVTIDGAQKSFKIVKE